MSKFPQRDDNKIDRLSSFLFYEGGLQSKKIDMIKSDVMLLTDLNGEKLIVKQHHNQNNVRQQWEFFSKVPYKMIAPFIHFPNGRKVLTDANQYSWTLTPYIKGRKLNYRMKNDRQMAVSTLKDFHQHASNVIIKHPIKKRMFYLRWYNRLQTFKSTEHIFSKYGYGKLYNDIIQKTERYIQLVSKYPWNLLQQKAEENGQWVHGDVASHNFIHNERTYLIDFDLLYCTTHLYDYIQLGQRFLTYLDWDIDELMEYEMVEDRDVPVWLLSIAIPSDVLREWLHYLSRRRTDQSIQAYLAEMEENWIKRKYFVKMAKIMIK